MANVIHIYYTVFILCHLFGDVRPLSSSEPESGYASSLQLMYNLMEDKCTLRQEVKNLKETVARLQNKFQEFESGETGNPRCIPGPYVNIAKDCHLVTRQSSDFSPSQAANLAIDGNFNTISIANAEASPWWSLEFCNNVIIAKVTLWNRSDCCYGQLGNLVVTVDGEICGHIEGNVGVGNSTDVVCHKPLVGRILKVQRIAQKQNQYLSIAEVQVFSSTS